MMDNREFVQWDMYYQRLAQREKLEMSKTRKGK